MRQTPGLLTALPLSKAGLRGKTAKDMRVRQWGELTALRQGGCQHWWFKCPKPEHPEFLLNGQRVRQDDERGISPVCPACKTEKVVANGNG